MCNAEYTFIVLEDFPDSILSDRERVLRVAEGPAGGRGHEREQRPEGAREGAVRHRAGRKPRKLQAGRGPAAVGQVRVDVPRERQGDGGHRQSGQGPRKGVFF